MNEHLTYQFGSETYNFNSRTFIMGILNVTPDSFSDGGMHFNQKQAVDFALKMVDEGADFIDVGGESTRPGSESIGVEEELRRVIPVIEQLAKRISCPISIDTTKSEVAEKALNAGAVVVNDISGLHADAAMADIASRYNATVALMHIKGAPRTMQEQPSYNNLIEEICSYLNESIQLASSKGIKQIIIDPGIGFGKTVDHNLEIIRRLEEFKRFHAPILIGVSRKSFIGRILDLPVDERLEGTAAAVAASVINGANIVRVHDVKEIKRVVTIIDAIYR